MGIRPSETSYRLEPLTVPCGKEATVRIFPLGKQAVFDDAYDYFVTLAPMDFQTPEINTQKPVRDNLTVRPENGVIKFTYTFPEEQEWTILVARTDQTENGYLRFNVYSLESDLYGLHPYCGDLHCHSARSDGKSDPAVVASYYRSAGYDFLALTDHGLMTPSREMIYAYEGFRHTAFHGEEIHL